jgi:anti-sigma B factor antagonist
MDETTKFKLEDVSGLRFMAKTVDMEGQNVLTVSGEIDAHSSPQFKQAVRGVLDEAEQHLVIDMSNVNRMDSDGFGVLIFAMKRLSPSGGTINLVGCNSTIRRILHDTHLDMIISFHQNMDDAMEAISVLVYGDSNK